MMMTMTMTMMRMMTDDDDGVGDGDGDDFDDCADDDVLLVCFCRFLAKLLRSDFEHCAEVILPILISSIPIVGKGACAIITLKLIVEVMSRLSVHWFVLIPS